MTKTRDSVFSNLKVLLESSDIIDDDFVELIVDMIVDFNNLSDSGLLNR